MARASLKSATGPPCNDSQVSGDTPQLACPEPEDDICWDGIQEEIGAAPESEAEAAAKQSSASPVARASLKSATSPPCHDSHVCGDTPQPACPEPEDDICWDGIPEEVGAAPESDVDVESVESWD